MKKRMDRLAHFETVCRNAGLKQTHQRREIFTELANASDHPSPEALYRRLVPRMPTISLDTVYRTLATLAGYNLVQRVETVQSQVRFEAVQAPHHHLICRRCQEVRDFPWSSFDMARLPEEIDSWGVIERKSAVLTGICSKCRKKAGGEQRRKTR
jgi:Fur family transcriptional regulator, peroxide stress response regulator